MYFNKFTLGNIWKQTGTFWPPVWPSLTFQSMPHVPNTNYLHPSYVAAGLWIYETALLDKEM